MAKVGDLIKIHHMAGEPKYKGRMGYVTFIDDMGTLHGTWGGCGVLAEEDDFEVLDDLDINTVREFKQ